MTNRTAEAPTVRTGAGRLTGRMAGGVLAFRGVEYAAPPVGERRFRLPSAVEPWAGVRDAAVPAPPLPQPSRTLPGLDHRPILGSGWHGEPPSLTLNVWTPELSPSTRCPVLVFVHCGGFASGTPNTPLYDGTALARAGIVCVTVAYRLGCEGFLALDDAPRNLGLHDVLFALRWVRAEIDAFGGDPSRITLAGQSAGAMAVDHLLDGPAGRGLAHRAISASGGAALSLSEDQAARLTRAIAADIGVAPTRAGFASVALADIVAATSRLGPRDIDYGPELHPGGGLLMFLPTRDEIVVSERPHQRIATAGLDALLAGTTVDEAHLYLAGRPDAEDAPDRWTEACDLVGGFAASPAQALRALAAARPQATPRELASALMTEALFRSPTLRLLSAHARGSGRSYGYELAWRSSALGGRLGACHCLELPAVFGTCGAEGLTGDSGLLGDGYPDGLASEIHAAWVRFVHYGDPGWAPYAAGIRRWRRFDRTSSLHEHADASAPQTVADR